MDHESEALNNLSDSALVIRLMELLRCSEEAYFCEYENEFLVSLHIYRTPSIDQLPAIIGQFRHLRTLRLTGQLKLRSLPAALGQLTNLEVLELNDCWLNELAPEIGLLGNLRKLRIQDTHTLTRIPAEIGNLTRLSTLSLAGNRLTDLPSTLGRLTSLATLDLSSNKLLRLPVEIGQLQQLSSLNLSYNTLVQLPPELGQLRALETLRLEHNNLGALPAEIEALSALESLILDWNALDELPPQTGQLKRLLTLSLRHNQLGSLPGETAQLTRLEHLYLEDNQLSTLPHELTKLSYLHPLNLQGNPLDAMPSDLLPRLTELPAFDTRSTKNEAGIISGPEYVQHEEIWLDDEPFYLIDASQSHHLPSNYSRSSSPGPVDINLNQVTLRSNRRQHYVWIRLERWANEPPLPGGQWDLISEPEQTFHLTAGSPHSGEIYLCDALGEQLSSKAFVVDKIEASKYYHIRILCRGRSAAQEATWNDGHPPRGYEHYLCQFWPYHPKTPGFRFAALKAQMGRPPDPSPLPEDGKILKQMAARLNLDLNQMSRRYRDNHIAELGFGNQPLHEFPAELLRLTHLTSLYLGGNQLTHLWPEIGRLSWLERLLLSDNQLTTLPPEIGLLSNLNSLEIRQNKLTELPPEIGRLTQLRNLNLDGNQLSSLPSEIGSLTQLTGLHLNRNQLTTLPATIGQLNNLATLSLSANPLKRLPTEIGLLSRLETLDLQNSFTLDYLPPTLGSLKRLQTLDVSYNNLQYLPREIGNILKLTRLNFSGNWLQELPRQIGKLPHLESLSISLNRLAELPVEMDQLNSLIKLQVDERLLSSLPARLQTLVDNISWPERKALPFETGPYYDSNGQSQSPLRMLCEEIQVDYSQFTLCDTHEHLLSAQQGTIDGWLQIVDSKIHILSTAQYHQAWVCMEAWDKEPPSLISSWELTSELSIIPHSGLVFLEELMGGASAPLELVAGKEPGCIYHMRASRRGSRALEHWDEREWEESDDEDDVDDEDDFEPIPHGHEQFLFQFWPG